MGGYGLPGTLISGQTEPLDEVLRRMISRKLPFRENMLNSVLYLPLNTDTSCNYTFLKIHVVSSISALFLEENYGADINNGILKCKTCTVRYCKKALKKGPGVSYTFL